MIISKSNAAEHKGKVNTLVTDERLISSTPLFACCLVLVIQQFEFDIDITCPVRSLVRELANWLRIVSDRWCDVYVHVTRGSQLELKRAR